MKPIMKRRGAEIGVSLCFVAVVLPIMLLRDFTPSNELRYLSIADEALRNHTFFAFSNYGAPYADKPPLYLWIVMLCRYLAPTDSVPHSCSRPFLLLTTSEQSCHFKGSKVETVGSNAIVVVGK